MKYLSRLMALVCVMALFACGAAAEVMPLAMTADDYASDLSAASDVLDLYNSFMASQSLYELYVEKMLPAVNGDGLLLMQAFTKDQVNAVADLANALYDQIEAPTTEDGYDLEDCILTLNLLNNGGEAVAYANAWHDDKTLTSSTSTPSEKVTIQNMNDGGEANWQLSDGVTLTINATITIPSGCKLDLLVPTQGGKAIIKPGTALGSDPMFIVKGGLKIAKTQSNDNQNHGSIEINGGTIEVEAGGSLHMEDITTVSGTTEWKFAEGSSVEIFGDIPVSGKLTITGPSKDSPVNITRRYTESSMFYVNNGASLSIANAVIDGKDTEVDSEIIFVQSNTESLPSTTAHVNVSNTTFKNCNNTSTNSRSGVITLGGYSRFSLNVDGCTFDNCDSISGAGIYFVGYANGTASIKNSTFKNCTTQQGGAIRTNGNGGVVATVEQCVFENNHATNRSPADSHGGAIYWNACGTRADGTTARMDIYDCQFIGNSAGTNAGAVFNESFMSIGTRYSSNFTMTQVTPGNIRGTLITGNRATYGGGVEVPTYGGGAEPHNGVGADLTLNTGVFIIGNTAEYGGGLAMRVGKGTVGNANPQDVKFEININGAVIKDNTATKMGGGIYLEREKDHDLYPSTVNLTSGTISGNSAPKGGAVCVYNANNKASIKTNEVNIGSTNGNLVVEKNTSTEFGGAVYISYGDVTMINGTIQENEAKYGGAIYVDNGQYEMTGGTIQNNNANENGGAVYVGGGSFTISGGTMDSNVATTNGGAAYVSGGAVTIGAQGSNNNATPMLSNNHAVNGGAIYVDGQTPTMYCGTLSGNYATNNGGAIYVNGGGFTMNNGILSRNGLNGDTVTTVNGGSVYVTGGKFTFGDGEITGNKATTNGGAVYVTGNNAEFIMQNGTASSNAAQNGGAVYVSGGNFTMNDGTMNANTAENGGAAFVAGGNFTMISGKMLNNGTQTKDDVVVALTEYGGAVYVDGGNITIGVEGCAGGSEGSMHTKAPTDKAHPIIKSNKAQYGGAFAVRGENNPTTGEATKGIVNVYCSHILGNEANNQGTGHNIFMDGGGLTHYANSAIIGDPANHEIVTIGGQLKVQMGTGEPVEIKLIYDSNSEAIKLQWTGSAPQGYTINLPYCPKEWQDIELRSFVGWAEDPKDTGYANTVRDKEAYLPIGTPIQVKGSTSNTMIFYAVWAPTFNGITYAYTINGTNIVKVDGADKIGIAAVGEDDFSSYTYQPVSYKRNLPDAVMSGYTFEGWLMYADTTKVSNWGADPIGVTSDNVETTDQIQQPTKWTGTIDRNFGDITLVAVFEPAFSGLKIVVADETEEKTSKLDANESYYFKVEGTPSNEAVAPFTMYVSIIPNENGDGSTTIYNIPVGTYTITEINDWSWRYSSTVAVDENDNDFTDRLKMYSRGATANTSQTVNIPTIKQGKTVIFDVTRNKHQWLDDNANTTIKH